MKDELTSAANIFFERSNAAFTFWSLYYTVVLALTAFVATTDIAKSDSNKTLSCCCCEQDLVGSNTTTNAETILDESTISRIKRSIASHCCKASESGWVLGSVVSIAWVAFAVLNLRGLLRIRAHLVAAKQAVENAVGDDENDNVNDIEKKFCDCIYVPEAWLIYLGHLAGDICVFLAIWFLLLFK
jgi:hypothetical protein